MKALALGCIRLYQVTVSRVLPPSCRFVPSCSEYGYEAIQRYGVIRGGGLAIWRILRCNPWGGHGYDPVPDLARREGGAAKRRQAADDSNPQPTTNALSTQHSALSTHSTER
jgi:putative membrane protein insertion efficiency factor